MAWLAAAAAVSPLLFAGLIAPAWAERVPGGASPGAGGAAGGSAPATSAAGAGGGQAAAGTALGQAGVVESTSLAGPARLQTPSRILARAVVLVPARSQASIAVRVSGRACSASATIPAGRSTLSVACQATAMAVAVPALGADVVVRLDRVDNGVVRHTVHTGHPTLALDDGAALAPAVAAARWRALAARLGTPAAAAAPTTATALTATTAATTSRTGAADAASLVWDVARRTGWRSAATRAAIADLLARRKPGGGYGLETAWDAYGDGTVNPASTTYTVTTAGHVGWVLLEARKNGALPDGALESAIDAVLAMPRLEGGTCLAYSNARPDATAPCVFNVSHGAAAFLVQARGLSDHRAAQVDRLVATLRSGFTRGYDPATGYWRYKVGDTAAQDISHQIYTARSVDVVDPGFHAVQRMMARPWWRQPNGTRQSATALASAMMDLAKDCGYARSPAVLLAAERGAAGGAPAYTRLGMAAVADQIVRTCFPD